MQFTHKEVPGWLAKGQTVKRAVHKTSRGPRTVIEVPEQLYNLLTFNWHLKTLEKVIQKGPNMHALDAKQLYNIMLHMRTLLMAQPGY